MTFFKWKDEFETGVMDMDSQHRQFMRYMNELHTAISRDEGPEAFEDSIRKLERYAEFHFSSEESLLKNMKHETLDLQRVQHDYFRKQLQEFRARYDAGEIQEARTMLMFMRDWFMDHILGVDREYGIKT